MDDDGGVSLAGRLSTGAGIWRADTPDALELVGVRSAPGPGTPAGVTFSSFALVPSNSGLVAVGGRA